MLSYSGLVNYGKSTLPSVESWNTNNNIVRDPPKSIMTRRKDKVGDTSQILATLADSDDRFCEAINYYARGVNPMVSVSYGEGQTHQQTSTHGQAFLPYRIMKDGAFRPPIQRQEDLLPLSRLPRNWTTVDARPFEIDYTKRMFDCGTAETTKEVKTQMLQKDCETRKIIAAEPHLTAPAVKYMLKDPLAPGLVTANKNDSTIEIIQDRPPVRLTEMRRPNTFGLTNKGTRNNETPVVFNNVSLDRNLPSIGSVTINKGTRNNETPVVFNNVNLDRNLPPIGSVTINKGTRNNETPVVFNNVSLDRNLPMGNIVTNKIARPTIVSAINNTIEYDRLLPRTYRGGYEGRPGLPIFTFENVQPNLVRVR